MNGKLTSIQFHYYRHNMILTIVKLPASSLRERSKELERYVAVSTEIQSLIDEMIATMYGADGIGLAAPQVGHNIRLCVIGKNAFKNQKKKKENDEIGMKDIALINPSWTKISKKTTVDVEGCLSVPGSQGEVKRYKDILVTALNDKGEKIEFEAHGYLARVIQHEIDHLDGILFIDRASKLYDAIPS